ncbi:hypothetical protein ACH437_23820 [Streptomyces xinghaiensis]|uniref:hypothetical protein n=1 Tax=Streptomyces xinghaiensis TaxID=1038928 RepID=UPI0037A4B5D3
MTLGLLVLAVSLAALVVVVRGLLAGRGRHRAVGRTGAAPASARGSGGPGLAPVGLPLSVLRRRPGGRLFRSGPVVARCPAEGRVTPHVLDAGGRRCSSCKTLTPATEETSRG